MAFIEIGKTLYNLEGQSYEVQAVDKTDSGVDYVHLIRGDDIICYMSVEMAKELLSEAKCPEHLEYTPLGYLTDASARWLINFGERQHYTYGDTGSRSWEEWYVSFDGEDYMIETYVHESGLSRTRINIYEDDPEFGPFLSTVWVRERQ